MLRQFAKELEEIRHHIYEMKYLAKAGYPVEALDAALKIEKADYRWQALASVVEALANAGKPVEALDAARKIENTYYSWPVLVRVVEALAKAGRPEQALDVAREIWDAGYRSRAQVKVVEMLARGRETANQGRTVIGAAQQAAEQITKEDEKSAALANVATGLAKLHLYRQARELVNNNNTSAGNKLAAYTTILREYHLERHPDQAKLFEKEPEKER